MVFSTDVAGIPSFSTVGINYVSKKGVETQRVITIRHFNDPDENGKFLSVTAFCHGRRMLRNFNVDRIIGLFYPDTGEVLTSANLVPHLGAMPALKQKKMDEPPNPATMEEVESLLRWRLESMGWAVKLTVGETYRMLGCYKTRKNGDLLKHPTVSISYNLPSPETGSRPWRAGSVGGKHVGAWGSAGKAIPAFLAAAEKAASGGAKAPPVSIGGN